MFHSVCRAKSRGSVHKSQLLKTEKGEPKRGIEPASDSPASAHLSLQKNVQGKVTKAVSINHNFQPASGKRKEEKKEEPMKKGRSTERKEQRKRTNKQKKTENKKKSALIGRTACVGLSLPTLRGRPREAVAAKGQTCSRQSHRKSPI